MRIEPNGVFKIYMMASVVMVVTVSLCPNTISCQSSTKIGTTTMEVSANQLKSENVRQSFLLTL